MGLGASGFGEVGPGEVALGEVDQLAIHFAIPASPDRQSPLAQLNDSATNRDADSGGAVPNGAFKNVLHVHLRGLEADARGGSNLPLLRIPCAMRETTCTSRGVRCALLAPRAASRASTSGGSARRPS